MPCPPHASAFSMHEYGRSLRCLRHVRCWCWGAGRHPRSTVSATGTRGPRPNGGPVERSDRARRVSLLPCESPGTVRAPWLNTAASLPSIRIASVGPATAMSTSRASSRIRRAPQLHSKADDTRFTRSATAGHHSLLRVPGEHDDVAAEGSGRGPPLGSRSRMAHPSQVMFSSLLRGRRSNRVKPNATP